MNIEELLTKLSLEQKASLLVGYTNMTTTPIEELGIPSLIMSDGPNGVRKEGSEKDPISGATKTLPATCFPCGSALAQSFDNELLEQVGKQIALECKYYNVNAILGPAINIKRNPLCGRNFEYLSEDPYLAGHLSASYIKGVQSEKVVACVKHYACNNLEQWRYVGDSIVDKRALHEIYLKPFEIAVKEAKPGMLMTSYNQINGKFGSENDYLLNQTLIGKWGFDGLTVTDWGGMVHRDLSLNAGNDLEMPGMVPENVQKIIDGVKSDLIIEEKLNSAVRHLLETIEKTRIEDKADESVFEKSNQVALNAAIKSAVLLKNNDHVLPLDKNKKLAIIGDLFGFLRFQGGGSALINAREIVGNKQSFDDAGIDYVYARGYDQNKTIVNLKLESEALKICKNIKTVLFFGGLTDLSESEGYDRPNMKLEKNQRHLLRELAKLGKTIICVFYGGAPFEIPAYNHIDGILYMNLPGQMGGLALTKLLFGDVSPSGRLAVTWPKKYIDVPFGDEFCSSPLELYKESIFVGYRYYSTFKKDVRFPFGYGLTYGDTSFSDYKVAVKNGDIIVSLTAKNNCEIEVEELIQVYIEAPHSSIKRPLKELKGYKKINLLPNEEKTVEIKVLRDDLGIYLRNEERFAVEGGEYVIHISKDAETDLHNEMVKIKGETITHNELEQEYLSLEKTTMEDFSRFIERPLKKYVPSRRPYTMETPICEYRSLFGKIVRHEMLKVGDKIIKSAKKNKDENEKQRIIKSGTFLKEMILRNCMRSLLFSSGGIIDTKKAEGILLLANGHLISGLKKIK